MDENKNIEVNLSSGRFAQQREAPPLDVDELRRDGAFVVARPCERHGDIGDDPRGIEPAIDRLRYAGVETHVVHLVDPSEVSELGLDAVRLVDAERDLSVELTLSPAILAAARERSEKRIAAIARACTDRGVTHHHIDVRRPFEDSVLRILRRGGLVG